MAPLPPTRERPVVGPHNQTQVFSEISEPSVTKPGRRWLKRLGVVVLVLLAVVIGAFAALAFVAKHEIDDFVAPKNEAGRRAQKQLAAPLPGKPTNILVLGSDHRAGDAETDKRSDTMMLVRLDPVRKTISVLSFPRDLWVGIPGHGNSKINDAYGLGGAALAVETVKNVTGQDVNFVMDVDFQGFRGIIDTFEGIYVDVDRRYFVAEGSGYSAIDIKPGYQRLMGKNALAFARHRRSDSDFHRIARQQQVLTALKKQIAQSGIGQNVPQLLRIISKNTEVVGGGGKGVPLRVLADYVRLGLALDGKDIYQIEYDGVTGEVGNASVVTFEKDKMDAAVRAFVAPSKDAREKTADQLVGKEAPKAGIDPGESEAKTEIVPPAPSEVTVTVFNGSSVNGAAATMAGQLRNSGYQVVGAQTNADHQNYANTRIQYRRPADKLASETLAERIEGATVERATNANSFDTKLLVIVGARGTELSGEVGADGFDGGEDAAAAESSGPAYSGNVVPEKDKPLVTKDLEYGRSLFAQVDKKRLRMPLLYPTVRSQGSTYEEVHQYVLIKGKTTYRNYRLVVDMNTGTAGSYWGLQGTTWPDPPILDSPTRKVTRKGRTYQLYFNGTRLHMVAWRQGAGTYWVTNTVLDKLSNSTMLAIAEGVRVYN